MGIRRKSIIVLTSIVIIAIMLSCDSTDKPNIITTDGINLAPANVDQKIYACESTMTYHLANCQRLTPDKVVMLKSEAITLGYSPCEICFPQERVLIEHTYVTEDGYYHRFLCPLLNNTEKSIIPKADAIQQGYQPCPVCSIDIIVPGGMVYVCPFSGKRYHGYNCYELKNCNSIESMSIWKANSIGYTPCEVCNGRALPE